MCVGDAHFFPAPQRRDRSRHDDAVVVRTLRIPAAQPAAVDDEPVGVFLRRAAERAQERRGRREPVALLDAQAAAL